MKLRLFLANLLIFFLAFAGCQSQEKTPEPSIQNAEIEAVGDSLSNALMAKLKGELMKAIEDSGIVSAIRVCNARALPLTDEVSRISKYSVKIKRISSKYRNPRNAPDEIEQSVLQYFEKLSDQKSPLPDNYLQKVEKDGRTYYKYYKPIQMGGLCLNCHGDPQQMNPEVVGMIDELYPEDMAKGYQAGDFRGLVTVTLSNL